MLQDSAGPAAAAGGKVHFQEKLAGEKYSSCKKPSANRIFKMHHGSCSLVLNCKSNNMLRTETGQKSKHSASKTVGYRNMLRKLHGKTPGEPEKSYLWSHF